MKVEIWSDLICPWCGLGQHRLDKALAAFAHRAHVELVHRSFLLDPGAPDQPVPARDMLRRKYGMNETQLAAAFQRIESLAAADGLTPYVVGDNLHGNTRRAHELLAMASARGLEHEAWNRLYRAHFGERRSIFDLESLISLGQELGLEGAEVREALATGQYRAKVEDDLRQSRELGITGVPFGVVDRRLAISGAQPTAVFTQALERAWRENPRPLEVTAEGATCGPDGCELPPPRQ